MPNWKRIIVSGSNAVLNSVTASNGFFGTASVASKVVISGPSPGIGYIYFGTELAGAAATLRTETAFNYNALTNRLNAPNITATTITGSLQGTSSWAQNAISASWAPGSTPITFINANPGGGSYSNLTTLYVSGSGVTISNPSAGIVSMSIASAGGGGSGTTFSAGNINNRVVTATGTTPELNGEANLTFDSSILVVTGSLIVAPGGTVELRVTGSGVTIGNALTDIHSVTGSLKVTGSISAPGSNTQVLYNNNGVISGASGLAYDNSTGTTSGTAIIGSSILQGNRAVIFQRTRVISSNDTVTDNDYLILVDTTGAPVDIDLTTAQGTNGRVIVVKDYANTAGTNNITFSGDIDLGNGYAIANNREAITLIYDGSSSTWWVVAKFVP